MTMTTQRPHEHRLFMLGGVAALLHWLEALAVILSGPLLTIGLGIALTDLLTDGKLLASEPWLLYAWAISQAVGVDAQLVGSSYRIAHSLRSGRPWAALGYGLLVVALAYVGFIAAQIFATQQAQGITTAAALTQLGMNSTAWILQRSALSVALVVLSGLLRYVSPGKQRASLEDERAELQRELELEPLRQQLRAGKAMGAAALVRATIASARGQDPQKPPTGGGTPVAQGKPLNFSNLPADEEPPANVVPMTPPRPARRPAARGRANGHKNGRSKRGATPPASYEAVARAAWADGAHTIAAMRKSTGMSQSAASGWVRTFRAEGQQEGFAQ